MPACAVLSCKNTSTNVVRRNEKVSFHRFPNDPNIKERWIEATGKKDWFPTKHSRMCSVHFNDSCFAGTDNQRRLTEDAIPTTSICVLKMSINDNEIYEPLASNKGTRTLLNSPKKIKLAHKLNLAEQKIKRQSKLIKVLREQNRRKGLKIISLMTLLEYVKNTSFIHNEQGNLLNSTDVSSLVS